LLFKLKLALSSAGLLNNCLHGAIGWFTFAIVALVHRMKCGHWFQDNGFYGGGYVHYKNDFVSDVYSVGYSFKFLMWTVRCQFSNHYSLLFLVHAILCVLPILDTGYVGFPRALVWEYLFAYKSWTTLYVQSLCKD